MCELENHVPNVAFSEERGTPDDPSKASSNRSRTPGAGSSGDWSREVLRSDVPGHLNPGQASDDLFQFSGVGAL